MSTFKGIIAEFPHVRVDYFRQQPEYKAPLACFLSHVHSDHLAGLEFMRAPFVYCSAATKEILLRLEKYRYRINFANGVLESRNVTYDRSMRKLAKALPLDTPTIIELAPGNSIQVTLVDANHCIGAVMFLIEGDGKAVLYTGDIRAETCKAEGIRELLSKVSEYPEDTIFYFHSWTFGYEDVWLALSAFLKSRVHLDEYRARIYGSLSTLDKKQLREIGLNVPADNKTLRDSGLEIREAPALCGFKYGNHIQPGCLTSRESVRIHSCEQGMGCRVIDHDKGAKVVHIIPIITRTNGVELAELGAGGGKGDMDQKEELETGDVAAVGRLMELCAKTIQDETLLSKVLALLQQTLANGNGKLDLDMQLQKMSGESHDGLSLQTLVSVLSTNASKSPTIEEPHYRTIRFPYSRHSSYFELCELVKAFKPKDVFPCTVDEERWTPDLSMQSMFGRYCSDQIFRHDSEMTEKYEARLQRQQQEKRDWEDIPQDTQTTEEQLPASPITVKRIRRADAQSTNNSVEAVFATLVETLDGTKKKPIDIDGDIVPDTLLPVPAKRKEDVQGIHAEASASNLNKNINGPSLNAQTDIPDDALMLATPSVGMVTAPQSTAALMKRASSCPSSAKKRRKKLTNRHLAYEAAIGTHLTWADYGGLTSTRTREDREEQEL